MNMRIHVRQFRFPITLIVLFVFIALAILVSVHVMSVDHNSQVVSLSRIKRQQALQRMKSGKPLESKSLAAKVQEMAALKRMSIQMEEEEDDEKENDEIFDKDVDNSIENISKNDVNTKEVEDDKSEYSINNKDDDNDDDNDNEVDKYSKSYKDEDRYKKYIDKSENTETKGDSESETVIRKPQSLREVLQKDRTAVQNSEKEEQVKQTARTGNDNLRYELTDDFSDIADEELKSAMFVPPPNEKPVKRFPQALVIGFAKCGTRALQVFLSMHPYVVSPAPEMHFYDDDTVFVKGYDWYLDQFPPSYSNQITLEKTPAYVISERARKELHLRHPNIKLIVTMKDPVDRLIGQFLQKHNWDTTAFQKFSSFILNATTQEINLNARAVDVSIYDRHIEAWMRIFPRRNFLFIDGYKLISDPYSVLKKTEQFLRLPPRFKSSNFVFNATKKFYCFRRFTAPQARCFDEFKGFPHPKLLPSEQKALSDFFRPHNERLFSLIGERFDWKLG